MDESILTQLRRVRQRYDELTAEMGTPDVAASYERLNELARERSELSTRVELLDRYEEADQAATGARALLTEDDPEMRELASVELADSEARLSELHDQLMAELVPRA